MKKKTLRFGKGFKVLMGNRRVQAAQMVIAAGDSEGGPRNQHRGADQCLLVIAGTGTATVSGTKLEMPGAPISRPSISIRLPVIRTAAMNCPPANHNGARGFNTPTPSRGNAAIKSARLAS